MSIYGIEPRTMVNGQQYYIKCNHHACSKKAWQLTEEGYDHDCCGNDRHYFIRETHNPKK